nr:MAG TPA: hypothetical protein [Caudoviricetes sp.]
MFSFFMFFALLFFLFVIVLLRHALAELCSVSPCPCFALAVLCFAQLLYALPSQCGATPCHSVAMCHAAMLSLLSPRMSVLCLAFAMFGISQLSHCSVLRCEAVLCPRYDLRCLADLSYALATHCFAVLCCAFALFFSALQCYALATLGDAMPFRCNADLLRALAHLQAILSSVHRLADDPCLHRLNRQRFLSAVCHVRIISSLAPESTLFAFLHVMRVISCPQFKIDCGAFSRNVHASAVHRHTATCLPLRLQIRLPAAPA